MLNFAGYKLNSMNGRTNLHGLEIKYKTLRKKYSIKTRWLNIRNIAEIETRQNSRRERYQFILNIE
jgi:hypothetical protein